MVVNLIGIGWYFYLEHDAQLHTYGLSSAIRCEIRGKKSMQLRGRGRGIGNTDLGIIARPESLFDLWSLSFPAVGACKHAALLSTFLGLYSGSSCVAEKLVGKRGGYGLCSRFPLLYT